MRRRSTSDSSADATSHRPPNAFDASHRRSNADEASDGATALDRWRARRLDDGKLPFAGPCSVSSTASRPSCTATWDPADLPSATKRQVSRQSIDCSSMACGLSNNEPHSTVVHNAAIEGLYLDRTPFGYGLLLCRIRIPRPFCPARLVEVGRQVPLTCPQWTHAGTTAARLMDDVCPRRSHYEQ